MINPPIIICAIKWSEAGKTLLFTKLTSKSKVQVFHILDKSTALIV